MAETGRALLILALLTAFYGAGASIVGTRRGDAWVASGRRAAWALGGFLTTAFFCALLVFSPDAHPFAQLATPPPEGSGLNPLLRHPAMMVHPPLLYSGYTLSAVPFAFGVGALLARRVGGEWLTVVRRFALA